jgi:hypothetical protein
MPSGLPHGTGANNALRKTEPCKACGKVHDKCAGHKKRHRTESGQLEPCQNSPMVGKATCYMHSGRTAGMIHKQGVRHTTLERIGLSKSFQEFMEDPARLHVTEEIALLRSRLWQILDGLPDSLSPSFLADAYTLYRQATRGRDEDKKQAALSALGEMLEEGSTVSQGWQDALQTIDQLRRMARVEQQHDERLRRYIALEHIVAMCNRQAEAIRARILDTALRLADDPRALLNAIADDLERISHTVLVDPKPQAEAQKALPARTGSED